MSKNRTLPLPASAPAIQAVIAKYMDGYPTQFLPWMAICKAVLQNVPGVSADDIYPSCRAMDGVEYRDCDTGIAIRWRLKPAPTTFAADGDRSEPGGPEPIEREAEAAALVERREKWQRLTDKLRNTFGGRNLDDLEEVLLLMAEARGKPVHSNHPGIIARAVANRVRFEGGAP